MADKSPFPPVLIYMPDQRVLHLASETLRVGGFDVRSAGDIFELRRALELLECKVIVTITAKIGEVREFCSLPLVNIQAFVLPNIDDTAQQPPTVFDRSAFLGRVRHLHQERPALSRASRPVV